jgi:benzoyl-CoA reductase subunit D
MTLSAGIDVGTGAVKIAIFRTDAQGTEDCLSLKSARIRRRDVHSVIDHLWELSLRWAGVEAHEIDYTATTGDGEDLPWATGHFYGMTTHARGAIYMDPEARAVLDVGALHARAIRLDERARVLQYQMTSQCASGTGQFLENIARYLGVTVADVGELSLKSEDPEMVSSICAVLAETDVINMVSRGIKTEDILRGIHQSMALRFAKLLRSVKAEGVVMLTGGLSGDVGLHASLAEALQRKAKNLDIEVRHDERGIHAGAIGAALWGAYRHRVLLERSSGSTGRRVNA